jgi:Uma2 family endonuclease
MPVSEATYKLVALEDPEGQWELVCGRLRQKPHMTNRHDGLTLGLGGMLSQALDLDRYLVATNSTRLRISTGNYYVPDLCVLPVEYMDRNLMEEPDDLQVHRDPVPLVVEVWSPSTGTYDVETKLKEYQLRGDAEIWRIHPRELTLTTWRRQPDGSYTEQVLRSGTIRLAALPEIEIDIARLFRWAGK